MIAVKVRNEATPDEPAFDVFIDHADFDKTIYIFEAATAEDEAKVATCVEQSRAQGLYLGRLLYREFIISKEFLQTYRLSVGTIQQLAQLTDEVNPVSEADLALGDSTEPIPRDPFRVVRKSDFSKKE